MDVTANERRARPNRTGLALALAALLAGCLGTAAAQSPQLTDAELRDLREEARSVHVAMRWVPSAEPTAGEMRDLRLESRLAAVARHGVPPGAVTEEEMRDLRRLARREQVARQNAVFGTAR